MYNHAEIEKKWQERWLKNKTFKTENISKKPKYYVLDMFPYPSGAGLHVGHPEGYTANDIIARYMHAKGYNVLHPMGWDAFGLPAENYAIKTGTHPRITTAENIATFKRQIQALGFSYDWEREIDTTDPKYFQWTQWIFLKLFEHGLAYEQDLPINYCPSCKTGLANEEVVQGRCERCDSLVEKRKIRQWVLAITKYAQRLASDVEKLDWPKGIKDMQVNWIGKSEGCEFTMLVDGTHKHFDKIYLASGNAQKLERMQKVYSKIDVKTSIERYSEIIEIDENGKDAMENALKKIEPYRALTSPQPSSARSPHPTSPKGRGELQYPIVATDSEIHFEGRDFDQTHIKREALKAIGKMENECTQQEVAEAMNIFYRDLAGKNGGKLEFYYVDAWAILFPNGEIKTHEYKRFYTLTDTPKGPLDIHFPMRNLYISQDTNKYAVDQTQEDFFIEFTNMTNALKILTSDTISVYTTRIDTVFSMAFAVIAPDHKDTLKFIISENKKACEEYMQSSKNKADIERTGEGKEKTGVFTGSYVINPFSGEKLPLWIGDFVLGSYGTGAVFGDAHDERDFEFGKKYEIDLKISIVPEKESDRQDVLDFKTCFVDDGILVHSGGFDGLTSQEARKILTHHAEKLGIGKLKINYKLRDWLFSRQRYWGEPIPLIHLEKSDVEKLPRIQNLEQAKEGEASIMTLTQKNPHPSFGPLPKGDGVMSGEKPRKENAAKYITQLARDLRKKGTETEAVLWEILRDRKVIDLKFRRQHPIGRYIADFYCHELSLVLEIDGKIHENQKEYDAIRDEFMKSGNYKILRVTNEDIETDIESIIGKITKFIPLPLGEVRGGLNRDKLNTAGEVRGGLNRDKFNTAGEVRGGIIGDQSGDYLVINKQIFSKIYDGIYTKIVCDYNLPLHLPQVDKYEPAGDGNSPLATVPEFVNVKLALNLSGKRETNTMPQWGGSCWYYLRFMDPTNTQALVAPEVEKYWGSVDSYVGGAEHAVLHLLYARFWHKFLFDIGVLSTDEPFYRLRNQGMILGMSFKDGKGKLIATDMVEEKEGKYFSKETKEELSQMPAKMSKSLKNVVNPDDVVNEYGADTLRLYEMAMGDFKDTKPWDTKAIIGVRRFLEKIWRLFEDTPNVIAQDDQEARKLLHKTIKKVGEDIEAYRFNTAISQMIICANYGLPKDSKVALDWKEKFLVILHPFAPHFAEELWEKIRCHSELVGESSKAAPEIHVPGKNTISQGQDDQKYIFFASWPAFDPTLVVDDTIKIGVQVNGKVRGDIVIGMNEEKESVLAKAKAEENVSKWILGKEIVKEVYVPGKILNIVVK